MFFENVLKGENETNVLPRWGGTQGNKEIMDSLINSIAIINRDYNSDYEDSTIISQGKIAVIDNKYIEIENVVKVSQLEPKPLYVINYSDKNNNSTTLGKLYDEYVKVFKSIVTELTNLQMSSNIINSDNNNVLKNQLESLKTNFDNFDGIINTAYSSIANNFISLADTLTSIFELLLIITYSLFIAISLYVFIFISFHLICKSNVFKILIHIGWNLSFISALFGLIIGSITGIISDIGEQISPVLNYLLSPSYMNSNNSIFGNDPSTSTYINTCLNGNGNLITGMSANSTHTQNLNTLITSSRNISFLSTIIYNYETSPYLINTLNDIDELCYHAYNIKNKDDVSIKEVLIKMEEISAECGNDFTYCLDKYECTTSDKIISADMRCEIEPMCRCNELPSYRLIDYCEYVSSVLQQINMLSNELKGLQTDYEDTVTSIEDTLEKSGEIVKSVNGKIGKVIGRDGEFFDLFNCGFMRKELIGFAEQISVRFRKESFGLGLSCILSGVFGYVGIYLMVVTLYSFLNKEEKEELFEERNENEGKEDKDNKVDDIDTKKVHYAPISPNSKND